MAFDSQACKRLEVSPNTIAESRSEGMGYTFTTGFRKDWRRSTNAATLHLEFHGERNSWCSRFQMLRFPGACAPGLSNAYYRSSIWYSDLDL
jgi:hypothetical protein